MFYHKFPNLGELIWEDLVSKPIKGLASKDFIFREYNFNSTSKVNAMLAYRGECCGYCVVYKVTCKCCGYFYVGNTQNAQKNWNNTSKMWLKSSRKIRIRTLLLLTLLKIYTKTKSTNILQDYCFWNSFYGKSYWINNNLGGIVMYTVYERKNI